MVELAQLYIPFLLQDCNGCIYPSLDRNYVTRPLYIPFFYMVHHFVVYTLLWRARPVVYTLLTSGLR